MAINLLGIFLDQDAGNPLPVTHQNGIYSVSFFYAPAVAKGLREDFLEEVTLETFLNDEKTLCPEGQESPGRKAKAGWPGPKVGM